MALMRVITRLDKDGKIVIPANIRRQAQIQAGQMVEMKVVARGSIAIAARTSAR
jgi:AbrB family looped-hinge helix DNA binding protein